MMTRIYTLSALFTLAFLLGLLSVYTISLYRTNATLSDAFERNNPVQLSQIIIIDAIDPATKTITAHLAQGWLPFGKLEFVFHVNAYSWITSRTPHIENNIITSFGERIPVEISSIKPGAIAAARFRIEDTGSIFALSLLLDDSLLSNAQ